MRSRLSAPSPSLLTRPGVRTRRASSRATSTRARFAARPSTMPFSSSAMATRTARTTGSCATAGAARGARVATSRWLATVPMARSRARRTRRRRTATVARAARRPCPSVACLASSRHHPTPPAHTCPSKDNAARRPFALDASCCSMLPQARRVVLLDAAQGVYHCVCVQIKSFWRHADTAHSCHARTRRHHARATRRKPPSGDC
mmetsp:Transcript_32128/g.88065  ORF Transcript_32128/g.88065 Transcript_32128/m.88065 type:complete len:204 (-) Transcript_32128:193-804(-)